MRRTHATKSISIHVRCTLSEYIYQFHFVRFIHLVCVIKYRHNDQTFCLATRSLFVLLLCCYCIWHVYTHKPVNMHKCHAHDQYLLISSFSNLINRTYTLCVLGGVLHQKQIRQFNNYAPVQHTYMEYYQQMMY